MDRRRWVFLGVGVALILAFTAAFALPVVGQDPSPSASADKPGNGPPAEKPGNGPPADKPGKGPKESKADKVPESPVTLIGRLGTRTNAQGETEYTLTVGSTVYVLHAGPPWWWGEDHPLAGLVGESVTITGEAAEGSTDVDVFTAGGETIREPGKPPWAGGWKRVGEKHPGWAQWKADKLAAKGARGHGPPPWAGPRDLGEPGD